MKLKIVLVDDHVLVREGIRRLVEFDGSMEVVAEASDGIECLEVLKRVKPHIVLLDINMPKMGGFEVLEELKAMNSSVKVLMLTVHNEVEYILRSVDIGADGYILKDAAFSDLKMAIEAIVAGDTYIQPQLIPPLNNRMVRRNLDNEKITKLTKREMEILVHIAEGYYNKEIGQNLTISERTVKNHISSIFKKLEVTDRTQAAVFAIKNNIVKL